MALHNGIDTVAIATGGVYSETYGSTAPGTIANLYASCGFLEDAPEYVEPTYTNNEIYSKLLTIEKKLNFIIATKH